MRQKTGPLLEPQNPGRTALSPLGKRRNFHEKVTMIVMPGCPYCANAKKALAALQKEAAYRDVQVELVDETSEADKVKPYAGAYYYVPTLFVDHDKSYEAHPGDTYEVICEAVEKALAAAK